jgi:hypothetical protein
VREVRDGLRVSPDAPKTLPDPLWMLQLDWPLIIHDLGLGHPLKFLWEEKAQHLTTYSPWSRLQHQSIKLGIRYLLNRHQNFPLNSRWPMVRSHPSYRRLAIVSPISLAPPSIQ